MSWEAAPVAESVTEGATTTAQALTPGEGYHVQVDRTDIGTTDDAYVRVFTSYDGVLTDASPSWERRVGPTAFPISIPVGRLPIHSFHIAIDNAESAPVDTIVCDVFMRGDGIDI